MMSQNIKETVCAHLNWTQFRFVNSFWDFTVDLCLYHVSVLQVKIPSMKASGGIHLTGSMARPPFL